MHFIPLATLSDKNDMDNNLNDTLHTYHANSIYNKQKMKRMEEN